MAGNGEMQIFRDSNALARALADLFVSLGRMAMADRGAFHVALAGGNTPRAAYELLAQEPWRDDLSWSDVFIYFGDERCVPPDDPESNYRMARETLLDPLDLRGAAVRRIAGELAPETAAADYDAELRRYAGDSRSLFDLVLLGMGAEGHTASLFPGSPALEERSRLAVAVEVPAKPPRRVTMTPAALKDARQVIFLVAGAEKADALAAVFADGAGVPAATVAALAPSRFLADEAAASRVPG